MLRYTTEAISKYWDNEYYRIFTFKMTTEGNLVIISSNSTNCRLYGFSEQCIGKSLYDVMPSEHAARWHQRFPEWKERGIVSYIAQFEDTSMAWDTTIEVVDNTLFGIGKKVTTEHLYQAPLENHELFNHFVVQQEEFILITLQANLEDNLFIIDSIYPDSSIGLQAFIGKDVSTITYHCTNILDKNVYNRALQSNKVVHFLDELHCDGESFFFDINLLPFSETKVVLYARRISSEKYNILQKKLNLTSSIYPESDLFGICELSIANKNDPYIVGCNSYFKKLLSETNIEASTLFNSSTFQQCLMSRSKESGKINVKNNEGETIFFEITTYHRPEENVFMLVLSKEEKPVVHINLESTTLSTRQQEIISYVANGYTNRYIANKLNISEGTVKKTIYNSYKKLGIGSRVELFKLLTS